MKRDELSKEQWNTIKDMLHGKVGNPGLSGDDLL